MLGGQRIPRDHSGGGLWSNARPGQSGGRRETESLSMVASHRCGRPRSERRAFNLGSRAYLTNHRSRKCHTKIHSQERTGVDSYISRTTRIQGKVIRYSNLTSSARKRVFPEPKPSQYSYRLCPKSAILSQKCGMAHTH